MLPPAPFRGPLSVAPAARVRTRLRRQECEAEIYGFPGARFKSFSTQEEALRYLSEPLKPTGQTSGPGG